MADFIIDWPLTISAASAVFACGAAIVAWAAPMPWKAVDKKRSFVNSS